MRVGVRIPPRVIVFWRRVGVRTLPMVIAFWSWVRSPRVARRVRYRSPQRGPHRQRTRLECLLFVLIFGPLSRYVNYTVLFSICCVCFLSQNQYWHWWFFIVISFILIFTGTLFGVFFHAYLIEFWGCISHMASLGWQKVGGKFEINRHLTLRVINLHYFLLIQPHN
jgi:hypothetical protein